MPGPALGRALRRILGVDLHFGKTVEVKLYIALGMAVELEPLKADLVDSRRRGLVSDHAPIAAATRFHSAMRSTSRRGA